jgi:cytochrome bd ubiquinol oxidase subunit I
MHRAGLRWPRIAECVSATRYATSCLACPRLALTSGLPAMDDVLAARLQMAVSLAFHMVFAGFGIGLPVLMAMSEWLYLRRGQEHYRTLALTWSAAAGFLMVIGAISGTVLALEIGLLWPSFMARAGATIGPAFVLEGLAFFIEAIFLGLYIYGWKQLSPWVHWAVGVVVAISALFSGVLVLAANAWMQHPFSTSIDPAGMLIASPTALFSNPTWPVLALHSSIACYAATGFAAAGIYGWSWLRGRREADVRAALGLALALGGLAALIQPFAGDLCAQNALRTQPVKFAAMEGHFTTRARAPLVVGGLADPETGSVPGGFEIPMLLSIFAYRDPDAVVGGLDKFPREEWPPVGLCHLAFQIMILSGMLLIAVATWFWIARYRHRVSTALMAVVVAVSPLGFVALEAGWIVTEVGRQPWLVYGLMRTPQV